MFDRARDVFSKFGFLSDLLVVNVQGDPIVSHSVGASVTNDVLFSGDAVCQVAPTPFVFGMLRVIQVDGYPVAFEESLWRDMDMILDGLPQLTVGAFGDVILGIFWDGVEDAGRGFAITLDASGYARITNDVQKRARFSLVRGLGVAVQLVGMVVGGLFAVPNSPSSPGM